VFFTTRDRLVGADHDGLVDLYDAREEGGAVEVEARSECRGEACQSSPPPPSEPSPTSSSFQGSGNLVASIPVVKPAVVKPLTRAQKLANALKGCHSKKSKTKRKACEKQARKRFGPAQKAKKKRTRVKASRERSSAAQSRSHDDKGAN
jgi:hypothetical protein